MKGCRHVRGRTLRTGLDEANNWRRWLLRAPPEWPHHCRAAEKRDELATPHSITSSASAKSLSGTVRLSAFAVLRLMMISNLVDCNTGRLAGFSPLRTLPA